MSAGVAGASHNHVVQTGSGDCVILAQNGNEKKVTLPAHLAEGYGETRSHPLHVLVHEGTAGGPLTIGVEGQPSDPCGLTEDPEDNYGYVNAP